ncbi:MAG: hypothetical protein LAP61_19850 [Acidobacteriia bacterium]|nr:hypothetical protein [Terriglobia bacterium]
MKLLWCFAVLASVPVWAQVSPTINELPSREFGQAQLLNPPTSGAPNLIEGRELNTPLGVAFAPSGGPMYVADTSNHRVLAWRTPASLTKGNQADLVIGQRDFVSNPPQGPGRDLTSGLTLPAGVAVDAAGNLYVLDGGNNRIVRYPNPFSQTTSPLSIDLVIGQKTQSSGNIANENNPKPTNHSLSFAPNGTFLRAGIALDQLGNLWVADSGNNRVLRFPASQLAAGTIEPAADRVLGQNGSFVTNDAPVCGNTCQTNLAVLLQPQNLAFDGTGALYVADGFARVLYYPNAAVQTAASQVLGISPTPALGQSVSFPNDYSLGNSILNASLAVFANGNSIFVADAPANRIVRYTTPASFVRSDTIPSPKIESVIGQPDLFSGKANHALTEPAATSLSAALGGAFDSLGNLWVSDTGNNRVLSYPASGTSSFTAATVVVGQTNFPFNAPNLIEGREVWFLANGSAGGGIVVDKTSNPTHLYIADTFNNRILGFRDARAVGVDARSILTQKPDLVIGQPAGDFFRSMANYPNGDPDLPTGTGLYRPIGLAVDESGNLFVADSGNGRVLRFPAPFSVAAGNLQAADLVLGQSGFTQKDQSASPQTLGTPYGLALYPDGQLAVSDPVLNRVMVFKKPFVNGEAAFTVVGQQSFASSSASSSLAGLNSPRHIATDTSGRLYVADSSNNRVVVFRDTSNIAQTGPAASFNFPNFGSPQGITVSTISGEMWVTSGNAIYHLPEVNAFNNTSKILQQIASNGPLAIALDSSENPIVAEAINRVTFYFAKLIVRNAFSFTSSRPMTPGMWAQAAPLGKTFSASDEVHETPPYPLTAAGLQMLVNGVTSGIYSVEQNAYINFVIPWEAPTSGVAEFLLFNPTTKEIVAAGSVLMTLADPAFRTTNFQGWGQVMAINLKTDGTTNGLNGPQNPVARGEMLQLALTGQGPVANPPADGFPPSALTPTNPLDLHVFIDGIDIGSANVVSSDLDPTYPGSWTVNIRIPDNPGPQPGSRSILVTMRDVPSNWGYDPNNGFADTQLTLPNGRITTISVK